MRHKAPLYIQFINSIHTLIQHHHFNTLSTAIIIILGRLLITHHGTWAIHRVRSLSVQAGGFVNSFLIGGLNQKMRWSCISMAEIQCCDINISMMTSHILIQGWYYWANKCKKVHNCSSCSNPKEDTFKIKVIIKKSY